ncbi:hypothetical protein CVT24_007876 [Panaeolus cyanescens]|uniref:Uncharacterized protein n=1 Tax=Panaeolus cyanescens TaxID=181874 RepID=A0A409WRN1_9AGAR|nr:hypothetical protein CVT24_007876 [Panaeolus cyanescens]
MPHPGVFQGSRKEFLQSQKEFYKEGILGGYVRDAVAIIQRRYFKRYPIGLPHNEEPTQEHLDAINDEAPDPDEEFPNEENLTPEEYAKQLREVEERRDLIMKRKKQIKRWLEYQHMKDNDVNPAESGALNPFSVLLFKLTGIGYQKPRLRSAVNTWRRAHRAEIEEEAQSLALNDTRSQRQKLANIREKVAKEKFDSLSEEDQRYYRDLAKEEHEAAMKQWEKDTTSPPSTSPEDRQRAIEGVIRFMQPILDGLCAATGWKATLAVGGPEPANGGRFRMLSINSGTVPGNVKMNFTRSEAAAYHKHFTPMFGEFLRKCYTVEECRSRALSSSEGFDTIQSIIEDSDIAEAVDLGFPKDQSSSHRSSSATPGATEPPSTGPRSAVEPRPSSDTASVPSTLPSAQRSPVPVNLAATPPSHSQSAPADGISVAATEATSATSAPTSLVAPAHTHSSPESPQLPDESNSRPPTPFIPPSRVPTPDFVLPSRSVTPDLMPTPGSLTNIPHASSPPSPSDLPTSDKNAGGLSPSAKRLRSEGASVENEPPPKKTRCDMPPSSSSEKRPLVEDAGENDPPRKKTRSAGQSTKVTPLPKKSRARKKTNPSPLVLPSSQAITTATSTGGGSDGPLAPPSSNSPDWFRLAMEQFTICPSVLNNCTAMQLGEKWVGLVRAWSDFEHREDFGRDLPKESQYLSPKGRPSLVGDWIARKRRPTYKPHIDNLRAYGDCFWSWWTSLQPEWRISDGEIVSDRLEGDWGSLKTPGSNGILSVMCALLYWGLHAYGSATHTKEWLKAVEDCQAVFQVL